MLHWQRLLPDRALFFCKLLACSFGVHLLFLLMLFFLYQSSIFRHRIDVQLLRTDVPVTFEPLVKRANKRAAPAVQKHAAAASHVKKEPTAIGEPVKKQTKKLIKKQPAKSKPKPQKKKVVQKSAPPKQEKKEVPKDEPVAHEATERAPAQVNTAPIIGQAEMDALHLQRKVHGALRSVWRSPPGIARDVVCHLTILIDWSGSASSVAVAQSSGVPAFDKAAKRAAQQAAFPRAAWGKEITVAFRSATDDI